MLIDNYTDRCCSSKYQIQLWPAVRGTAVRYLSAEEISQAKKRTRYQFAKMRVNEFSGGQRIQRRPDRRHDLERLPLSTPPIKGWGTWPIDESSGHYSPAGFSVGSSLCGTAGSNRSGACVVTLALIGLT